MFINLVAIANSVKLAQAHSLIPTYAKQVWLHHTTGTKITAAYYSN
ncbi:hypothetical protein [Anabaena sp. CCY 9402-a]